ncbi:hypothetical protein IWQ60_009385 [Tieghemiomyces parasiticus]|uniref:Uncharacterized protein n=1 Tax=Tieghemiomyces parasiticus TaxID=78921 RepID=A0A9W7ZU62_9FUNG|nr:hypothetical protein IWQ60_009385 [Tieghemiomyces parasiticus]
MVRLAPFFGRAGLASLALVAVARADLLCSGDPDSDNFPDKVSVGNGANFTVTYSNNYKIVTNQLADETYGLYCGDKKPSAPDHVKNWYKLPINSTAVLDYTLFPYLEVLGLTPAVRIADDRLNVTTPCTQSLFNDGSIVAYQNATADDWAPVQVAFDNSFSNDTNYVAFSASDDRLGPLERAEWIKYVAVFFNMEANATEFYQHVTNQYSCHRNNLAKVDRQQIAYSQYSHAADTGAPLWTVNTSPYYDELTTDAGAHIVSPPITAVNSTAAFRTNVQTADYMIDLTPTNGDRLDFSAWKSLFGYSTKPDKDSAFYFNKQVWRPDLRRNAAGNLDWVQSSAVRPDLALADLITVQYPKYQDDLVWFENTSGDADFTTSGPGSCGAKSILTDFTKCPASPDLTPRKGKGDDDSDGLGAGAIVGIVIGVVAALLLAAYVYVQLARRRRRQRLQEFINLRNRHSGEMDDQREAM